MFNKEDSLGGLEDNEENGYIAARETIVHVGLQGVTGDSVKRYKVAQTKEYPAFIIKGDKIELFQVNTLKNMLTEEKKEDIIQYHCYVMVNERFVRLGLLNEDKLKNILSTAVFERFEKRVEYEDGEVIDGDDLYALCTLMSIE